MNKTGNKSQRGAVSIMTIFMVLVMVTLGVFALTSARVNYTFSDKTLEWNRFYYALEDKAERYVMNADRKLMEAAETAKSRASGQAEFEIAFRASLEEKLGELAVEYGDFGGEYYERGGVFYTAADFVSDDNAAMHLRVSLKINTPLYDGASYGRYSVREWTQYQVPSGVEGGTPVWDGIILD